MAEPTIAELTARLRSAVGKTHSLVEDVNTTVDELTRYARKRDKMIDERRVRDDGPPRGRERRGDGA